MFLCRLFRSVLTPGTPGWKKEAARTAPLRDGADWLAAKEAEVAVAEPSTFGQPAYFDIDEGPVKAVRFVPVEEPHPPADFAGCDCLSCQAADLDDHERTCGAHRLLRNPETLRRLLDVDDNDAVPLDVRASFVGGPPIPSVTPGSSPTVGDRPPLWGDGAERIEQILEFHAVNDRMEHRHGLWCRCGMFCLNTSNHRRHQAQVIDDLYAADTRIAEALHRKAQG